MSAFALAINKILSVIFAVVLIPWVSAENGMSTTAKITDKILLIANANALI